MRILVTGAAGFIGTNFVYDQLEKGLDNDIICLDALTYAGNLDNLREAMKDPKVRFVKGDITDRVLVEKLFKEERFDLVMHLAAESHVDRSIDDPGKFLSTNIMGSQILMDACRHHDVPRFHMVSTDEVYGDLPLDRPDLLFSESSPIRPSSPYATSKAAADLLTLSYHRTYGMAVTVSRCSNNYGPHQLTEKLIPFLIQQAFHDRPLTIYGNGLHVRDWLHVRDHCSALDLIVRKGKIGEVYNIGGSNERNNLEIAKAVLHELSKPESLISYVRDRPGHDIRYAIDSTKLRNELGWRPVWDFSHGIRETVKWYVERLKS